MKKWEGTPGSKMWFLMAFRFVTLINDLWIKFSGGWFKLLWLQLIWILLQANQLVNEEMRGYTRPQNSAFHGFSLCDLDLWCLDQMFWRVMQTNLIAVDLRPFATESTVNQKTRGYTRPQKAFFMGFLSMILTNDLWINFSGIDANHSDCC